MIRSDSIVGPQNGQPHPLDTLVGRKPSQIRHQWVDGQRTRALKSKKQELVVTLGGLLTDSAYSAGDRLVFWYENPGVPLFGSVITTDLRNTMKVTEITCKSFHSLRHFANTFMIALIGEALTRQIMRHHVSSEVWETSGDALESTYTALLKAREKMFAN